MQKFDGLELPPRKVAYLRFILERREQATTSDISRSFDVDPSTITKTLGELSRDGYLLHTPYKRVSLTPEGKIYADFLIRRHRILSLILTHYGISPEKACDEVSRFESFVSKEAVDSMCRSLGHPVLGVCGTIPRGPSCCPDSGTNDHPESGKTSREKRP
ncbi:MAG: metal-dependent transcriptional regulator [Methanoregulaceae archaeon]